MQFAGLAHSGVGFFFVLIFRRKPLVSKMMHLNKPQDWRNKTAVEMFGKNQTQHVKTNTSHQVSSKVV